MDQSIFTSVKRVVGLAEGDTSYDEVVILHTNSVFSILTQLGIGPPTGFEIEDDTATWDDLLDGDARMNFVKSYVYLRVRNLFDPPQTSFLIEAMEKQYQEFEWRINVVREGDVWQAALDASS